MADEKPKAKRATVTIKSHQAQLNEIDAQIEGLQVKKKALAALAIKEINETAEMPLHQLNAISKLGYEEAKKKAGADWIE